MVQEFVSKTQNSRSVMLEWKPPRKPGVFHYKVSKSSRNWLTHLRPCATCLTVLWQSDFCNRLSAVTALTLTMQKQLFSSLCMAYVFGFFDAPRRRSGTHFLRLSFGSDSLFSVIKSRLKHYYLVGFLAITHDRLPPAPLKLRPYGVFQISLLLYCYYIT